MTSSSSMTSNGGAIERWPLGGSVDEYEKMLQREHQGWTAALREESQRLPMDGDEGGRQGHLMKNLKVHVGVLEEELDVVNKMVVECEERKCLLAALNLNDVEV